jgi:hypothetical protein
MDDIPNAVDTKHHNTEDFTGQSRNHPPARLSENKVERPIALGVGPQQDCSILKVGVHGRFLVGDESSLNAPSRERSAAVRILGMDESAPVDIPVSRVRYSRLAIVSGMTALLFVANCVWLFGMDHAPMDRWIRRTFRDHNLVTGILWASAFGWAPVSLVLSSLCLRRIRRNPCLRGVWIAWTVSAVATLGTAAFVFTIIVTIWNP